MYNRNRRVSSILSDIDTLSDINTRAADQLRLVPHEHSITSFLESQSPTTPNEHLHDCHSPLEQESTEEEGRAVETAVPFFKSFQRQTVAHVAQPPKSPVLSSAPPPRHHQKRGTMANGAILRRSMVMDSPPSNPISERL